MLNLFTTRRLLFTLPLLTSLVSFSEASGADTAMRKNPFLEANPLPLFFPRFDLIKDEDYGPALEAGMAEKLKEVEAIVGNPAPATFENTIVALDRSGVLFNRVNAVFSNMVGCNSNPKLDELNNVYAPKIAAFNDAVNLNVPLFKRIESVYEKRADLHLDAESLRLVERTYKDFVRAGAKLNESQQVKMKALNEEIAGLQARYLQNVLKAANDDSVVVDTKDELAGLSDADVSAAAEAAVKAGKPGKYLLRLVNTSGQTVLSDLKNRSLRERVQRASVNRASHGGDTDTTAAVSRLAELRAERAGLLGFDSFAAYQLDDQTAGTVERVNTLLRDLAKPAVANARKEAAEMQKIVDAEKGGFQIAAWDWSFYSEKVRLAQYNFDETQLKPYFEAERVLQDGVFYAANKFYGLSFKERHDLPVYEPTVRVFDVYNEDGSLLALFVYDLYARPSKRGGAWMNSYVDQSTLLGTKAIVANHLNVPKPGAGEPTLMTYDEVRTLFHEFGHALHGMFSNVTYPRFSGTSVPNDFVEYPSQVNEMWSVWPEVLKHYARHYKTGEPMPQELVAKMLATRKFNEGFRTTEYLAAALVDQSWHQLKAGTVPTPDKVLDFENQMLKAFGVDFAPVPPRYRTPYFSHSFGGDYSAAYYAYIWSEVLDADSVEWISTHGGLTRANGDHFRSTLLSRGGSKDALQLFRDFSGGEPYLKPLLIRRGLTEDPK